MFRGKVESRIGRFPTPLQPLPKKRKIPPLLAVNIPPLFKEGGQGEIFWNNEK